MKKILGIDTGGTYTDSVVIHSDTKEILYKSKTLTTKQRLQFCIENCFAEIPSQLLTEISMVCLSTTLATNAIVENHGCREGLILIGSRPQGKMPTDRVALIKGKCDIKGRLIENIEDEEVIEVVESFRGKVDAIAVSGYASVRNPTHELYVKKIIEQQLSIPVVCAHELTTSLGFYERTVTADLNAKLIPMVCELMESVKVVMKKYQVEAPLMIVKGDGSLMTDAYARHKPIETILSGPAASVIGGVYLSGKEEALVLDIGGTTTDIASVTEGRLNIRNEGAKVGGWLTHVQAAEVFTVGLGGDSRIYLDSHRNIQIGPQKSIPLSLAGEKYPELLVELGGIYVSNVYKDFVFQDEEAYQLIKKYNKFSYSDDENIVIEVLRNCPHTFYYLEQNIKMKNLRNVLDELLRLGVIGRISLTPTDILHVTGGYKKWNSVIAEIGVKIAAEQCGKTQEVFISEVCQQMAYKLDSACIQAAMYFDNQEIEMKEGTSADYFLNQLFFKQNSAFLRAKYCLEKEVIAIGAPAEAWGTKIGQYLEANVTIPEHAEVANAVGAAVGRAIERIEILIRPDSVNNTYLVYSPINRACFENLEQATTFAFEVGTECVQRLSEDRYYRLTSSHNDLCIEDSFNGRKIFVERVVTLSAHFEDKNKNN